MIIVLVLALLAVGVAVYAAISAANAQQAALAAQQNKGGGLIASLLPLLLGI